MSATFLYGALLYFSIVIPLGRAARVAMAAGSLFLVAMTPFVSVWLGIHWPSDVLGSWLWCGVLLLPLVVVDRLEASDDEGDFPERLLG
jgi:undecaprenyl-diphosphatase